MSQRKDTGLNTNPWPVLLDHYMLALTGFIFNAIPKTENPIIIVLVIIFIQHPLLIVNGKKFVYCFELSVIHGLTLPLST